MTTYIQWRWLLTVPFAKQEEKDMFKYIMKIVAAIVLGLVLGSVAYSPEHVGNSEIYSTADGSVQFIVLTFPNLYIPPGGTAELPVLAGQTLVASDGKAEHRFTFASNVSNFEGGCDVSIGGYFCAAQADVLVATQGFADLNLVKPDFVVPNGVSVLAKRLRAL